MKFKRIGIDIAKNVFQLHGVDENDEVILCGLNLPSDLQ